MFYDDDAERCFELRFAAARCRSELELYKERAAELQRALTSAVAAAGAAGRTGGTGDTVAAEERRVGVGAAASGDGDGASRRRLALLEAENERLLGADAERDRREAALHAELQALQAQLRAAPAAESLQRVGDETESAIAELRRGLDRAEFERARVRCR